MNLADKFISLTKQLFPTGLAFHIFPKSWKEAYYKAINIQQQSAYVAVSNINRKLLPDNSEFDETEADKWERALAITPSQGATIQERRDEIARKLAHPGPYLNRQSKEYLQAQLDAAGFNCKVYENRFDDGVGGHETKSPFEVFGVDETLPTSQDQLGDSQLGGSQLGAKWKYLIVNSVENEKDQNFDIGLVLGQTFFISGDPITTPATINSNREKEFRRLVLKVKPAQTVAFLNINYN